MSYITKFGDEFDYLVIAIGTGGTMSGSAKFLKSKNPKLKTLAVDPEGSIYTEYFKTGNAPKLLTTYKVEGFGDLIFPSSKSIIRATPVIGLLIE